MMTIKELKESMPQSGTIDLITIRPEKRGVVHEVDKVDVSEENGLEGDHYSKKGGNRMVTLIQAEHISTVESILSKSVDPKDLRRNIIVSGINLLALHDQKFSIGSDVILEGTGYCHPCSRMEENLGPGGYNAMRGHGGLTTKVIRGGTIQKGDKVSLVV